MIRKAKTLKVAGSGTQVDQAQGHPLPEDTTSNTETPSSAPVEAPEDEAKQIAELKKLYREQLINALKSGAAKASMLAEVGKHLDKVGALDHKPGKASPLDQTRELEDRYKDLPFPVGSQTNGERSKVQAPWNLPTP